MMGASTDCDMDTMRLRYRHRVTAPAFTEAGLRAAAAGDADRNGTNEPAVGASAAGRHAVARSDAADAFGWRALVWRGAECGDCAQHSAGAAQGDVTIIREVGEPLALVVDYCLHLLCTIDSFLLVKHYCC